MSGWLLGSLERLAGARRAPDWTPRALRDLVQRSAAFLHRRHNVRTMDRAIAGRTAGLEDIERYVRAHAVPMRAPLVLISQVQRSGGTLLSQLFDGHPALAAYPQELRFGFTESDHWPVLDPRGSAYDNYALLCDLKFIRLVGRGFIKGGSKRYSDDEGRLIDRDAERPPFYWLPRIQFAVFRDLFDTAAPAGQRDVFDHYFASFFNAWLGYQGQLTDKKWITAFAPRLALDAASSAAFFESYPDGRLIQIVRDPGSWFPSASRHRRTIAHNAGPEELLKSWVESAEAIRRNKERYGDRVVVLRFEDLVGETERTMRALASELGIAFDPILLEPTFNGRATRANSSFDVRSRGVVSAPLERRKRLSEAERALVERHCAESYEGVLRCSLDIRGGVPRKEARA